MAFQFFFFSILMLAFVSLAVFNATTPSIMTISIITLINIKTFSIMILSNDTQHNNT